MQHLKLDGWAYNRTMLELKLDEGSWRGPDPPTYNRTMLELKCVKLWKGRSYTLTYNRTMLELKFLNGRLVALLPVLIIVQCLN